MTTNDDRRRIEASVRACYAKWSERYYEDYYRSQSTYPPVHTEIVRDVLTEAGARCVLDAGCGPASMLRNLGYLGEGRYGFDLTAEMVAEARKVMAKQGVPGKHFWEGSVLDEAAYRPPYGAPSTFDAAICVGVLPHIPESADRIVLGHLFRAVCPGGLVAVEARNQLFALFTLNRYSRAFFREVLLDEMKLRQRADDEAKALEEALAELDLRFRLDLPPVRKGYEGEPGYDEILSRTHNPFVLRAQAEEAGFTDVQVLFYHFHALPPMLETHVPNLFRRESVAMEDPHDWRGHFMASAFILVGRRAA